MKRNAITRVLCALLSVMGILLQSGTALSRSPSPSPQQQDAHPFPVFGPPLPALTQVSLGFEANQGQVDSQVQFLARGRGYVLWLTPNQAVLGMRPAQATTVGTAAESSSGRLLKISLIGANASPGMIGLEQLPGFVNYFVGNDPARWRTGIPMYAKVKYEAVYPGVDLVYYWNQGQLEYDFIVTPGADPSQIRLNMTGMDRSNLDAEGTLTLGTDGGVVQLHPPLVYQLVNGKREIIASRYLRSNGHISIEVAAYDPNRPLIIDPVLTYSTYLGGALVDQANSLAVDGSGNAYVAGVTQSTDFPVSNAAQAAHGGGSFDAFVTKIAASGTSTVYSTYLGGNALDAATAIAVDGGGNAYITGRTSSGNFPTASAVQAASGGSQDGFVTKLSSTGSIVYSTYLGGSGSDEGDGIAVDSAGQAYITGLTVSSNFPGCSAPCAAAPFQAAFGGGADDAFVTKLSANGAQRLYSTYLGGSGADVGAGIAVDGSGNAYVTGFTSSNNFPAVSAFQATFAGGDISQVDAFVTKVAANGASLVYSTYLGGAGDDNGVGIALDASNNAYVAATTRSNNFPIANAFQGARAGAQDAFVTKLTTTGTSLAYSTYLGGSNDDISRGIAVDNTGNAYVTGLTLSPNFPLAGAFQTALKGGSDDFVTKLRADGLALIYSTFLGGSNEENSGDVAIDGAGNIYVTGWTLSSDFPTASAMKASLSGTQDAFVSKFPATANLINISTRGLVQAGDSIMIGGFVVGPTGSPSKRVIIRARGPALAAFGVPGTLADPVLNLIDQASNTVIATSDNWQSLPPCAPSANCEPNGQIVGTGFDPCLPVGGSPPANCDKEAVLIVTLPPTTQGYTALVNGSGGGQGVGLVEVTEFEAAHVNTKLVNISTRSQVQSGANQQIGGFIVGGVAPKRVLIRARGPALAAFGVAGTLTDPVLNLVDQTSNQVIATNDNWQTAPACQPSANCESTTQIQGTNLDPCAPVGGGPPSNCDKEAVLIVTLTPSALGYTALVSGAGGAQGIGLIEINEF